MKLAPMRILVVDDSIDTARMMALLLKAEGHKVKTAYDAEGALKTARELRPDVVLLDLTLPDRAGGEVAEELRRTEGFETTAIVAVTGKSDEGISNVFDGHFLKPIDHDALNGYLSRLATSVA